MDEGWILKVRTAILPLIISMFYLDFTYFYSLFESEWEASVHNFTKIIMIDHQSQHQLNSCSFGGACRYL